MNRFKHCVFPGDIIAHRGISKRRLLSENVRIVRNPLQLQALTSPTRIAELPPPAPFGTLTPWHNFLSQPEWCFTPPPSSIWTHNSSSNSASSIVVGDRAHPKGSRYYGPASGRSGFRNAELIYLFKTCERKDRSGRVFDFSAGHQQS